MTKLNTLEMTREEWLRERQKGIGGSDAGAVLGVNPYRTPLDVFEDKTAEEPIIIPENPAMKAGKKLEEVVAKWYEEATGHKIQKDNKIRKNKDYPFLIADIDRLIIADDSRPTGVLEIKTTRHFKAWEQDGPPDSYYAQMQHYLMITSLEWGSFAVLEMGVNFYHLDVTRDEEYINKMMEVEIDFWQNYVQKRIPPDPINKADVIRLWPESKPLKFIEVVPDVYNTYIQIKNIKEQIKGSKEIGRAHV